MIHSHVKWSSHVKYLCLAAQNEMLTIEMKVQKLFLSSCHFDGLLSGLGCALFDFIIHFAENFMAKFAVY